MEHQPRILVAKSLTSAQRALAFTAGFRVVEADFIQIQPAAFSIEKSLETLLFTSQNAVLAVAQQPNAQQLLSHPVYVVGRKTKALLERLGFTVLAWADHAAALAPEIVARGSHQQITFFCGNIHSPILTTALEKAGITFEERVCYSNVATPVEVTSNYQAALFFSPSAVRNFAEQNAFQQLPYFSIGPSTTHALQSYTQTIIEAPQATIESVIAQCAAYFKKQQTPFA